MRGQPGVRPGAVLQREKVEQIGACGVAPIAAHPAPPSKQGLTR